jgi:hypothetical protein
MAMSQAAIGKMVTYLHEGKPTPLGWGLDKEGQPTTDPRAMLTSKRILPFGEHKGAGLAIMMELLTGALSGSMLSYEIGEADPSGLDPNSSKLFIAIDVQAIEDIESLSASIEKMYQWMHRTDDRYILSWRSKLEEPGSQSSGWYSHTSRHTRRLEKSKCNFIITEERKNSCTVPFKIFLMIGVMKAKQH